IYENKLSEWSNKLVNDNTHVNEGVLLPPRRRYLCIDPFRGKNYKNNDLTNFKKDLLDAAYSQGRLLRKKYPNYNNEALQAMKYCFADYGNIIKGTDMMNSTTSTSIKTKLENLLKNAQSHAQHNRRIQQSNTVNDWWTQNKKHVWHAMLCGYKSENNNGQLDQNWCTLPKEDETDQVLRWMTEWAQKFCKEKVKEARSIVKECNHIFKQNKYSTIQEIQNSHCKNLLTKYEQWFNRSKEQWDGVNEKYNNHKSIKKNGNPMESTLEGYLIKNCSGCDCTYDDIRRVYDNKNNPKQLFKELKRIAIIDNIDPSKEIVKKVTNILGKDTNIINTTEKA
ncbi:putative EMP1-like protein, partial [Plasmodium gaboni]